jgi:hypothetical protein
MKKTQLEKLKGKKVEGALARGGIPHRFAHGAAEMVDRREQRKRDQALGLVPFAVKLNSDLIKQIQELGKIREIGLNELVAELLQQGLKKGGK